MTETTDSVQPKPILRCLVTGGAGFIGRRLSSRLADDGHQVLVLDRHRAPQPTVIADVSSAEDVRRAFDEHRPDVVFHLAGLADARAVRRDPVAGVRDNVLGTCAVLDAARRVGTAQVVVASSIFVYAATPEREVGEDEAFLPAGGGHVHVTGFIARELLAHDFHRAYGLSATVFRLAPIYGPGMWAGLAPQAFIDAALRGGPIVVYGAGTDRRRFLHVDDLVEAFARTLDLGPGMRVYNVQGPREITVNQLAEIVSAQFGGLPIAHRDEPARRGELDCSERTIMDGRAELDLGWRPRIDIVEGLRLTMAEDPAEGVSHASLA